jgi:hypothetical protein
MGLKMSHGGTCNKCGEPRNKGNHQKCDRWPSSHGCSKGFHYVSNSKESDLADLKTVVAALCVGDDPKTPVRFELKILQTRAYEPDRSSELKS